jgi:EF-hand domain-containing protein 1
MTSSMTDLPNLPGVRRDVKALNPQLYREFQASRQDSTADLGGVEVEAENSLASYFENPENFEMLSKSISAFPSQGNAYNDINGRYSLRSQQADRLSRSRSLPYCNLDNAPAFVTEEARVLRFFAFFEEEAPEALLETRRARNVEICLYLADNTLEIVEPSVLNSGLSQGKVLKRHQVPKPMNDGSIASSGPLSAKKKNATPIFTYMDFDAGERLNIYNRIYTITDCDNSTKKFLEELGRTFGESRPGSSYYWDPKMRPGNLRHKKVSHKSLKNLGFYEYERKVLRFFGIWDGRENLFGDDLKVRIHYSLADNQIEVLPISTRNSGRDKLSRLLKKSTIMKKPESGEDSEFPLSYSQAIAASGTSRSSTADQVLVPLRPYHWKDLYIGAKIAVASLFILVSDADEFTREFYKSKNMALDGNITMPVPTYPTLQTYIPPYNPLFGGEEDSLQTCKGSLAGSGPLLKDGAKAKLFAGQVLKFLCSLENPKPADETRKFVIQFKLEDDSVQIMEPPQRNSGHKGGTFLSRGKIQTDIGNGEKRPMLPEDIVVGAIAQIRAHRFVVHDADDATYKHMEEHPDQFDFSNIKMIGAKLSSKKEMIQKLILSIPGLQGMTVKYEDIDQLFRRADIHLLKQEVVTLLRMLDPQRTARVRMTQVLKFIMGA